MLVIFRWAVYSVLTSHTDVARLTAGVFLGINGGQAHELVSADGWYGSQRQIHWLRVDHLQDDVLSVVEQQRAVAVLRAGQEAVVGSIQLRQPPFAEDIFFGAVRSQDQDDVVVGGVHAVEIPKVDVGVLVEENVCLDLWRCTEVHSLSVQGSTAFTSWSQWNRPFRTAGEPKQSSCDQDTNKWAETQTQTVQLKNSCQQFIGLIRVEFNNMDKLKSSRV